MKNYSKVLIKGLLLSLLMLIMACGTMEKTKTEVSDSANAMSTIREYARTNGNATEPTIQDYNDATVRGVEDKQILDRINGVLKEDEIGADEIQAPTDIQTLLYERDILDIPSSQTSSPTISAPAPVPVVTTPPPVATTPPPVATTPPPVATTPPPVVTTPPPVVTTPPIEPNFKMEDKKGDVSLTLKDEGNVTIELGEEYDYENGYEVKEGNFNYLMNGTGVNGETIDINASDYLENKDKVGTYVIYYTLVDKKKKPILKIWRLVTITSDVVSTPSDSLLPSDDNYNGDHNTANGITIKFKSTFPTNTVYLGDKSLNFNPKDFKATKDDGTDVTTDIEVDIVYNGSSDSEYDKTNEGNYEFKYSFDGKEIAKYSFTISKNDTQSEPSPTSTANPSATPIPTATPVPLNETINITDIELKLKYDDTFKEGREPKAIPTEFRLHDPGYYFVNKTNGKRLYIITIQTKEINTTKTIKDKNGKEIKVPTLAGYDTKYGVSYTDKTIKFYEYNEGKGNKGVTIVDENGGDVTNYLWQNLSIDNDHNNGSDIRFGQPTDGYIAMPYVLNRKGEMTNKYVFNNYEDESKNRTDTELESIHKKAKKPYAYAIRYIKAVKPEDLKKE